MQIRPSRRDLIAIVFKQRHVFLLLLLGAMAGGGIAVALAPKVFVARAELVLPVASHADPAGASAVQRALLRDAATARAAIERAGLAVLFPDLAGSPDGVDRAVARLAAGLSVRADDGGRVIVASLALDRPDAAQAGLAGLLHAGLDAAGAFEARAGGARDAAYWLLAEPERPAARQPLHKGPIMGASLCAGLILALAGVAARERFDDRFTTPWQTASALSLPVLASFPRQGEAADLPPSNRQV